MMEDEVLCKFKCQVPETDVADDFQIEYEILPAFERDKLDPKKTEVAQKIAEIDAQSTGLNSKIESLNSEIERLTNHADKLDYMVAVASGVLCGMIDSFFVGEFSLTAENGDWKSSEKVNDFVIKTAKKKGYKGDDLEGAIRKLEEFHIASDPNLNDFGGGLQHHLRDFAHHPTPLGLFFSLITQFTTKCYGTNTAGAFIMTPVKDMTLIGRNLPEKFTFGVINWVFHMISDMAGSHATAGAGTGLPGPIVSLLKEVSSLPFFQVLKNSDGNAKFSVWVSKLFNGTLFAERDSNGKIIRDSVKNFDLRAELSLFGEITRQAIPVVINECIVRGFYFIRHFAKECKRQNIRSISDLNKIDYKNILPFRNRTIVRMLTISTGTFTAIDLADAAIRSAIQAGPPTTPAFWGKFVLKVNFVGLGRFFIAVGTDIGMGIKRQKLIKEKMQYKSEYGMLQIAKLFYMQEGMWIEAVDTEKAINDLCDTAEKSMLYFVESCNEISENIESIDNYVSGAKDKNPELVNDMIDILEWG